MEAENGGEGFSPYEAKSGSGWVKPVAWTLSALGLVGAGYWLFNKNSDLEKALIAQGVKHDSTLTNITEMYNGQIDSLKNQIGEVVVYSDNGDAENAAGIDELNLLRREMDARIDRVIEGLYDDPTTGISAFKDSIIQEYESAFRKFEEKGIEITKELRNEINSKITDLKYDFAIRMNVDDSLRNEFENEIGVVMDGYGKIHNKKHVKRQIFSSSLVEVRDSTGLPGNSVSRGAGNKLENITKKGELTKKGKKKMNGYLDQHDVYGDMINEMITEIIRNDGAISDYTSKIKEIAGCLFLDRLKSESNFNHRVHSDIVTDTSWTNSLCK